MKTRSETGRLFWAAALALILAVPSRFSQTASRRPEPLPSERQFVKVLRQIYREVKDLGAKPGEDFISQEFFLGPDEDDSYKNEHIAVLIQEVEGREKMQIQVTEMKTVNLMPHVQAAGKTRAVRCSFAGDSLQVEHSDFSFDDLDQLMPEILRAVIDKKKLLKLFDRTAPSA